MTTLAERERDVWAEDGEKRFFVIHEEAMSEQMVMQVDVTLLATSISMMKNSEELKAVISNPNTNPYRWFFGRIDFGWCAIGPMY